jgi:alginate O-acetyltransferase complex protein AlgI
MTFNSVQFFALLAVVIPLYWTMRLRAQNVLLLVASYVFYGWWDARFVLVLAFTTVFDFFVGQRIGAASNERVRRGWVVTQVSVNLAILAVFKYFNFFVDSGTRVLDHMGLAVVSPALHLVLPVGISFYVFHEISYAMDIYRRRLEPERNIITYALFIAYFPLLMAGPIERAWHLLPQLRVQRQRPDTDKVYSAVTLIVLGLFKKVVIADGVARIANAAFNSPAGKGTIPLATGMLAFAIQIYGDFSGYTDIARGVSRLLGIEVFRNFEQPYLSTNITQFWRTWHISLSSWLHDYLYVPLGGNRGGPGKTYRNLFITMLLGGLWHGAQWHFVVWGGLHGIALAVHRARGAYEPRGRPPFPRLRDVPRILATFTLVCVLWVIFRARTLSLALRYLAGLFTHGLLGARAGNWLPDLATVLAFASVVLAIDLMDRARVRVRPLRRITPAWQGAFLGAAVVALIVFSGTVPTPFIYFQF